MCSKIQITDVFDKNIARKIVKNSNKTISVCWNTSSIKVKDEKKNLLIPMRFS